MLNFTMENFWAGAGFAVLIMTMMTLLAYRYTQGFQINSYYLSRQFKWLRNTRQKLNIRMTMMTVMCLFLLVVLDALFFNMLGDTIVIIMLIGMIGVTFLYLHGDAKVLKKTPLKLTKRVARQYVLIALMSFGYGLLSYLPMAYGGFAVHGLMYAFSFIAVPIVATLSFIILAPFEKLNSKRYIIRAGKKLAALDVKVVGITGSYGKTSIKDIAYQLLSAKFNVVKTPSSFNTPLGVSRTILNDLSNENEIFIAEMGAKRPGDIEYLCKMCPPDIAVITAIAPQHMEYFKSIQNIERAKYEIVENKKRGGKSIFGSLGTEKLYEKTSGEKYSVQSISVDNVKTTRQGTAFTAKIGGETAAFSTNLIGKHNIENILLASLIAIALGMTLPEIAAACKMLEKTPHRLEIIDGDNDLTIIDDSYNSNPVSAEVAIDLVAGFEGKKVIVTPGFIEQGENKALAHEKLAEQIAKVFDEIILVGANQTEDIYKKLISLGFDKQKIYTVTDIFEAKKLFTKVLERGANLLLLNDLPDSYTESI